MFLRQFFTSGRDSSGVLKYKRTSLTFIATPVIFFSVAAKRRRGTAFCSTLYQHCQLTEPKASSRITARSVCRCLVSSWVYVESQLDLLFVYWCFCANNLCLCLQSSIFCSVSRVYVKFFWFLVSVYSDSGSVHGCFPALFGNRDVFPAELSFSLRLLQSFYLWGHLSIIIFFHVLLNFILS